MSQAAPLVLWSEAYWISPYVFSCYVGLREKQVPFETKILELHRQEQREPAWRARSYTGKVPALEHGPLFLSESSAIVEYLDEAFPPPRHRALLPTDREQRARAREILAWLRTDLAALREERPTTTMFYAPARAPLSPAARSAAERLVAAAERLVPEGATSLFREWSIADADLAFALHRLIRSGDALPERVRRFAETQWQRPSVRDFVDHERPASLWPEAPELP